MKIQKYRVTITNNVIHGWTSEIDEYWIPAGRDHEGICFNLEGGDETFNAFYSRRPRSTQFMGYVGVDDQLVRLIVRYCSGRA